MKLTEEQELIRQLAQDIKDIINADENGDPYKGDELQTGGFHRHYADAYAYMVAHGIEEIS